MKKLLNFKNISYLVIAVLAIVASIVYIAIDSKDITFSIIVFVLALVGAALLIASVFLPKFELDFVGSLVLSVAAGFQTYASLPTLSDIWNQVNFKGGDHTCAIAFLAIFGALAIITIVFTSLKKKEQ